MKKLLLEIFIMMLASMGLVYGISGTTRLVLLASENYDSEIIYHVSLVAGLCGLIFFAILLNLLIIRRLKRLSVAVKEVAKGNYNIELPDRGIDEIHTLTGDFNHMTRELKANEYLNREFVKNVSHELKTPLSNIMGYAQLLTKPERTREEITEYANIVYDEAVRTLAFGMQMLELSRLNSTETIKMSDFFRVDEQIRSIILSLQNKWTDKNIDIQIEMDDCELVGNENLTYHIWQNLISNAIEYTETNGKISVKLKRDDLLKFEISNTGTGIAPEDRHLIFNQFFTSRGTRQNRGTGLGLPITKKIVDILQGKIWFTSTDCLTTFYVEL